MKVNLDFPIFTVDKSPVAGKDGKTPLTGLYVVCEMLQQKIDGIEPMRAVAMAKKLYETGSIELEGEDLEHLKNALKKSQWFYIVQATILEALSGKSQEQAEPKA